MPLSTPGETPGFYAGRIGGKIGEILQESIHGFEESVGQLGDVLRITEFGVNPPNFG
jgi:hypothetical protein